MAYNMLRRLDEQDQAAPASQALSRSQKPDFRRKKNATITFSPTKTSNKQTSCSDSKSEEAPGDNIVDISEVSEVQESVQFPLIEWPESEDHASNEKEDDEGDNNEKDALAQWAISDSDNETSSSSKRSVVLLPPGGKDSEPAAKRPCHSSLKRSLPGSTRLSSLLNDNPDRLLQLVYDAFPSMTKKQQVTSEVAMPVALPILFRLFQSSTTRFACMWLATHLVVHTAYFFITDFGLPNTAVKTTGSSVVGWTMDFVTHQAFDSLFMHVLITAMLIFPEKFGSNSYWLGVLLIQTQPIHLAVWLKSSFGQQNSSDGASSTQQQRRFWGQLILEGFFGFVLSSMIIALSAVVTDSTTFGILPVQVWSSMISIAATRRLLLCTGLVGFNLAPVNILYQSYKKIGIS